MLAIAVMLLLSLGVATSIAITTSGQGHAFRSNADQKSYALAEDGVNSATAVIFAPSNRPPVTPNCSDPVWSSYGQLLQSHRTNTRPEGSVEWWGDFVCAGSTYHDKFWRVTAIARVTSPTAPGQVVARTVKVTIPLAATEFPTTVVDTVSETLPTTSTYVTTDYVSALVTQTLPTQTLTTWDDPGFSTGSFYYSWGDINSGSGCPGGGGTGGASISTAVIVDGNFCLKGGSARVEASASVVSVRGTLTLDASNGSSIGTAPDSPGQLAYPMTNTGALAVVTNVGSYASQGMVRIDNEFITYSGTQSTANKCGVPSLGAGQGCLTNLTRGFLADRPAAPHAVGAAVDTRVNDVELGTCASPCANIHAATRRTGSSAQFVSITKPTIDTAGVRNSAAPGPNRLPGATCPLRSSFVTTSNAYYNGATVDLTPTSSYTCTATAPDGTTGQISWNNGTKELKVRGTVFVPANVVITQDLFYTTFDVGSPYASAALYITGTLDYSQHNVCALRQAGKTDCDTRIWNPNVDSELAIVMPNLPGQGTGVASNPSHTMTGSQNAEFQGFIYTDGIINRSGGNGFISGTVYSAGMNLQGGASTAPAPGVFRLPTGFQGTPHTTTVYTTVTLSTSTPTVVTKTTTGSTTVSSTTTRAATTTSPGPTTPQDFGG
jgi:hypothetical protein